MFSEELIKVELDFCAGCEDWALYAVLLLDKTKSLHKVYDGNWTPWSQGCYKICFAVGRASAFVLKRDEMRSMAAPDSELWTSEGSLYSARVILP